jgi:uncharacterized repeat protein (TIGR01451 family)
VNRQRSSGLVSVVVLVLCLSFAPVGGASTPSPVQTLNEQAVLLRANPEAQSGLAAAPTPAPESPPSFKAPPVAEAPAAAADGDPRAAISAAPTAPRPFKATGEAGALPADTRARVAAYQYQYEWTGTLPIEDNTCPSSGISTTIHVPDSFVITDLRVGINASHTYRGDIFARLTTPNGSRVRLLRDPDGSVDNLDVLLEDGGPAPDSADHDPSAPYYEHVWRPNRPLGPLAGQNAQGDWTLYVCDDAGGDVGTLHRWALFFNEYPSANFSTSWKAAAEQVPAGELLFYTISLSNTGPLSATNALLVDALPTGTTFAYTVTPPGLVYNPALEAIEWRGTLESGTGIEIAFAARVTDTLPCGALVTNTATLSFTTVLTSAVSTQTLQAVSRVWTYVPFETDLEADDGGFVALAGEWEWGVPSYPVGLAAQSGARVWGTDLDGDADDTVGDHILARSMDVPPSDRAVLTWWDWFELEGDDAVRVYVDDLLVYERSARAQRRWVQHAVDLSPWAGQRVPVRFDLNVNGDNPGPAGWYLDDIALMVCPPAPGLYLVPEAVDVLGCTGAPLNQTWMLHNWTSSAGVFDLRYTLDNPAFGTFNGPSALSIPDTGYTVLTATLTPEICLPDGLELAGEVQATGNGYSASARITETVTSKGLWEVRAPLPAARGDLAVVNGGNGALYAIGGTASGGTPQGENQRYDLATGVWSAAAPMPQPLTIIDGALLNGRIYIPGGFDGSAFSAANLVYRPSANTWAARARAPRAVAGYAVAACGGLLYRSGGAELETWPNASRAFEAYDPVANAWTTLAPMTQGHLWHGMACIGNRIYVAGGMDGNGNPSTAAEVYDIASGTWSDSAMADLPQSLWGAADFVKHDRFYLAGGIVANAPSSAVIYYDPNSDTWNDASPLREPRFRLEGDSVADSGAVLGGWEPIWTAHATHEYLVQCPECTQRGWLEGTVYDYDGTSVPCSDAHVHIAPGNLDIAVDASGSYSVALVPFTYHVAAIAPGYPVADGPYAVTVDDGTVAQRDFTLARPSIAVTPLALSASAPAGTTVTRAVTISNHGTYTLHFAVRERELALSVEAAAVNSPRALRQPPAAVGIDPLIEQQFATSLDGRADFFIAFKDTADLSPAYAMDWSERGRFVVAALKDAARRSQARVRAWLSQRGIPYTSLWINNTLFVHADRAALNALAAFPEVSGFMGNHTYRVLPVETPRPAQWRSYPLTVAAPLAPSYPWNVTFPRADLVHTELGLRGEGVVVGGMDTGVEYLHPGLVRNYRGCLNPPACTAFDHTYSWFNPGADECGGGVPCDTDGHGTATMGIMAGDDAPALPGGAWIGMAPNARWIHCLGLPGGSGGDIELNLCAQWFLAPGGNPDMRPQVVNHSWGSWSPNSCSNWYAPALMAYRAADILPAFAAGNVGDWVSPPHCSSSTPPANTVDASGNPLAFASGAHGQTGLLDYYSSGGPNACNPARRFPDLAAPGLGSCTTGLSGSYNCSFGGTSSASPHTAGCAALVRQAAPELRVAEIEQALRDAARDVNDTACGGDADWNNKYGEGLLDCYAAVRAVYNPDVGWFGVVPVSGTVARTRSSAAGCHTHLHAERYAATAAAAGVATCLAQRSVQRPSGHLPQSVLLRFPACADLGKSRVGQRRGTATVGRSP